MAGELERLLIRLEADTTQLRRALAQADSAVAQYASKTDRALSQTERRFASMARNLKVALGGASFAYAARETVQLADSYTLLNNRLSVVTKSTKELDYVRNALFRNSQDSRTDVLESAEMYSRMAFALKDTGASTDQLLKFTDILNKSIAVSGATTAEASGALRQLSQGLSAGSLRGQELNSVMEQLPIVADMIAKRMGVTIGELRKLGEQGKITGDLVFKAILSSADDLNARFSKVTGTVAQGFTNVNNSMLEFVGLLNSGTGASTSFANALNAVSAAIDRGNNQVKKSGELMAFFKRPGVEGFKQGSTWSEAIASVPQWISDRVNGKPLNVSDPAAYANSMMKGSVFSDESNAQFDPTAVGVNKTAGAAAPDPWAASIIPASAEEQLRAMKEAWDEVRQAQNATLDDLINANWQSGEAKMAALEKAVRGGEISWGDYQDGLRATESQTQRSNDAMLSATSQFLDTMFANNKTAATASALIDTYAGITRTLRDYSPPQSFAMAAMQAAMGFAQVRAIQSTSRRSSGGGAAASVPSGAAAAGASAAAPAQQTQTLTVRGLGVGELLDRRGLRDLLERIRDMQRDGYQLVVG